MKKVITILLSFIILFMLSGCSFLNPTVNESPKITGSSNLSFDLGEEVSDWTQYVTADDREDGEILITSSMIDASSVDFNTVGSYSVLVQVSDSSGKISSFTITIQIIEPTNVVAGVYEIIEFYTSSFEDTSKTSYDIGTIFSKEKAWTLSDALLGSLDNDQTDLLKSVRIRNGYLATDFAVDYLYQISFFYGRYLGDGASTFSLEISSDICHTNMW